jgi:hypothetical protein
LQKPLLSAFTLCVQFNGKLPNAEYVYLFLLGKRLNEFSTALDKERVVELMQQAQATV